MDASFGRAPPQEPCGRAVRQQQEARQRPGSPYLLVLPLLGFSGSPGRGGPVPVEVRGADVGRGDGGGGGGERDERPGARGGRLVAVLRGHGGVRPDGRGGQAGGRAGRPQRRDRGRGSLRGRHCRVRCGGSTERGKLPSHGLHGPFRARAPLGRARCQQHRGVDP